jgi:dTDP-4-dehydrorhamnose 3,5-epimerase
MRFTETELTGAWIVDVEPRDDGRGFFARTWCRDEFAGHGLDPRLVQCNVSFNRRRATLRGMHFQRAPHQEAKVVRCTRGRVLDVLVDLRPGSRSFCRWVGVELSADNHRMLYVPEGVAHGFQTLEDDTELFYQMSETYHPDSAAGVRWNDPRFGIAWPIGSPILSERDAAFPDFIA